MPATRQPLFSSAPIDDQRPKVDVKLLVVPIAFALLAALGTYYLVNAYVLHQARQNVRDILLSHRGLHLYIQRTMHEEFYRARTNQEIPMAYYAPEILSSSFMVRVLHGYYNEEREKAGLPPVYYKMAADNPRNPVNRADAAEAKLLEYFRNHPEVREYSEVEQIDGKTCLVFAMPFLRTEERCLACHGKREDAPQGLQLRYPQAGGYDEALGELRAIESLRIPIEEERLTATIGTLAALAGFGAVGGLLVFNRILNRTVRSRTAELASRERTVRRLLDAAESVPFEYMPETGQYTYVGPQFRAVFGAEPSVLKTGKDWEAMVHPGDRETTLRTCREATLRGEDHDCLLKVVGFDGQLKLIHQTVNIVQEAGKPLQVVGFLHDVTDQRRNEALQTARLAIAESAVELCMDDLVARLVVEVERLTGSRVGFFHFVDETQRKIVLQAWSASTPAALRVQEKGTGLPMDSAGTWSECLAQRKTLVRNEVRPQETMNRDPQAGPPLRRELLHPVVRDGNLVALIGVGNKEADYDAFDVALVEQLAGLVTEAIMRKRAEEEKVRLRVQLIQAQKLESIGRLAGGVAHDFNNVLAAMMMQLSFLQQKPDFDWETRQALAELTAEAQRAAGLTRQLLVFSRRSVLQTKVLDLNAVVAGLINMLSRLIGEHIKINFERGENLQLVEADQGMVEQVVMNLAVNARDAMPQGGRLDIRLTNVDVNCHREGLHPEARPGSFVCLSVTDSGCGMDEATLKRVFEPFFTTKEVGKGTGLGLATVHGIVAQHKGWTEVESTVGSGSSFQVFFPATSVTETSMVERSRAAVRGHETILLVEDEALLRRSVARGLRTMGYTILEAANGPEALAAWDRAQGRVDLLFTDMVMPEGMNGFELAQSLRKQRVDLKVVISSGYNEELAGSEVRNQAGMAYLQKPYAVEELSRTIRACLERG